MDHDCLHCLIMGEIDRFCERYHFETGEPVNSIDIINHVISVAAEFIAFSPDPKSRKELTRQMSRLLHQRVPEFRAQGRYPGGPLYSSLEVMH